MSRVSGTHSVEAVFRCGPVIVKGGKGRIVHSGADQPVAEPLPARAPVTSGGRQREARQREILAGRGQILYLLRPASRCCTSDALTGEWLTLARISMTRGRRSVSVRFSSCLSLG